MKVPEFQPPFGTPQDLARERALLEYARDRIRAGRPVTVGGAEGFMLQLAWSAERKGYVTLRWDLPGMRPCAAKDVAPERAKDALRRMLRLGGSVPTDPPISDGAREAALDASLVSVG